MIYALAGGVCKMCKSLLQNQKTLTEKQTAFERDFCHFRGNIRKNAVLGNGRKSDIKKRKTKATLSSSSKGGYMKQEKKFSSYIIKLTLNSAFQSNQNRHTLSRRCRRCWHRFPSVCLCVFCARQGFPRLQGTCTIRQRRRCSTMRPHSCCS